MCDHCGCGDEGTKYTLVRPGENTDPHADSFGHEYEQEHDHDHEHMHQHKHQNQHHRIIVETDILRQNDLLAARNRGYFEAKNILAINLVSSPGSGKTTLLERTIKSAKDKKIWVIEGDQQTTLDADRIHATGAPVIQVNTGSGCHLDAEMINRAVKEMNPENDSLMMIENVGNLVCPALFDLGEKYRVVIVSVTEGEDKPLKYPHMFMSSHLCLINKTDLLPYVDFDMEKFKTYARKVNQSLHFIALSAKTGDGFGEWMHWIRGAMNNEQ